MHTLAIVATLLAAAPPDWIGKHHTEEKGSLLFETGVGQDGTEAALDALGRFSLVLSSYQAKLSKDYQVKSAEPEKEANTAAGSRRFAQMTLGSKTQVSAYHKLLGDGSGSWTVKLKMVDGKRELQATLSRSEKQDELEEGHIEVTRAGLGLHDAFLDLEKGAIFLDTFCDGTGTCHARASMDSHRKPAERQAPPAPRPEWVNKGSGAFEGEKGRSLQAVGVTEPFRNSSLRMDRARTAARAELRKLVELLAAAVAKETGATRKKFDSLEDPLRALSLRAPIADEWADESGVGFALVVVDLEQVKPVLDAYGLRGPAVDEVFKALAGP